MSERRHKIRCPDCQTVITFRPKAEHEPGTRIQLPCICGAKLRTRIPEAPKVDASKWLDNLVSGLGSNPFTDFKA